MMRNKKGSVLDTVVWTFISLVVLVVLGLLLYGFTIMGDAVSNIGTVGSVNVTAVSEQTFGIAIPAITQWLPILGFVILIGGAISILISNFLIKAHPAFIFVYLIGTILAIIAAAYISNFYVDTLLNDPVIGAALANFTAGNFIMQWLPYFAAVIGIFGTIFLFMGILRDRTSGGYIG